MQLYHNSQRPVFRSPFGACPAGTEIVLRLAVEAGGPASVTLRLWMDEKEVLLPMQKDATGFYAAKFSAPQTPQLVWYYFIVTCGGETLYYVNNRDRLGGVGETQAQPDDRSYQITVYATDFQTPDWFKDSIMYQIFPDRFFGIHGQNHPQKRPEYILHTDWYEPIAFNPHPYEDGPACNDFYGGNLAGITAKLPYLQSLGISVLYLNPIFDAYSNHKYDTADYKTIDPMFGSEEDFVTLCETAESLGIRVILDGVFSHTGADSIYFNKYGTYGEHSGAYRDPASPYRSWYQFTDDAQSYNSWWGCSNLPNVNELEPSYLDYMLRDEDAVVKRWLRKGAKGWRLDVADELPEAFLSLLRENVKETDPDAVIIGEVWEDASNKVAYGKLRGYLLGQALDSVMNYPFKDQLIAFLLQKTDAETFNCRMRSLMENYPKEALYALMNIVGTHDTMRIRSTLGEAAPDCGTRKLTSGMETLAFSRGKLAAFLQMTFVGVPCIYYGDEVGMQGGKDPYNRGTYPWHAVDSELRDWYKTMTALRKKHSCLRRGMFLPLLAEGGVYAYARYNPGGRDAFFRTAEEETLLCIVNRDFSAQTVTLSLPDSFPTTYISEFSQETLQSDKDKALTLTLPPLSAALLRSV